MIFNIILLLVAASNALKKEAVMMHKPAKLVQIRSPANHTDKRVIDTIHKSPPASDDSHQKVSPNDLDTAEAGDIDIMPTSPPGPDDYRHPPEVSPNDLGTAEAGDIDIMPTSPPGPDHPPEVSPDDLGTAEAGDIDIMPISSPEQNDDQLNRIINPDELVTVKAPLSESEEPPCKVDDQCPCDPPGCYCSEGLCHPHWKTPECMNSLECSTKFKKECYNKKGKNLCTCVKGKCIFPTEHGTENNDSEQNDIKKIDYASEIDEEFHKAAKEHDIHEYKEPRNKTKLHEEANFKKNMNGSEILETDTLSSMGEEAEEKESVGGDVNGKATDEISFEIDEEFHKAAKEQDIQEYKEPNNRGKAKNKNKEANLEKNMNGSEILETDKLSSNGEELGQLEENDSVDGDDNGKAGDDV